MAVETKKVSRRAASLTQSRIVEAAIELLDSGGESALTYRALACRLATGSGALYWHVADKKTLMTAASNAVMAQAMTGINIDGPPDTAVQAVALGIFEAVGCHPWVGAQLYREPWQPAMLNLYEALGRQLSRLDVPNGCRFDGVSTLVNYILGVAAQNAANARLFLGEKDKRAFLAEVADQWARLDPVRYPFTSEASDRLSDHDVRDQFLAGVALILAGVRRMTAGDSPGAGPLRDGL